MDTGGRGTGRQLRDPGRYLVTWLAPLMLWWFNRNALTPLSLEEIRGYARERPQQNLDYGFINLVRAYAWTAVILVPFVVIIPVGVFGPEPADRPLALDAVFVVGAPIITFAGGMMLLSAFRWAIADYCDHRLDLVRWRTRTRDGRPVGRVWTRFTGCAYRPGLTWCSH